MPKKRAAEAKKLGWQTRLAEGTLPAGMNQLAMLAEEADGQEATNRRACLQAQALATQRTCLLARSLLSATAEDLASLIAEGKARLRVPIRGVIAAGQAVERALAGVPHQLCQFHYLREAAKPIYEADRHAKKELKKLVRGVRPIERKLEKRREGEGQAVIGYCQAVRSALP